MWCRRLIVALAGLISCSPRPPLSAASEFGPRPELPEPRHTLIPRVKVLDAVGWSANGAPVAAEGVRVTAFARGLNHPRWLAVLPNRDVLVAETNAPPRPDDGKGVKGFFFGLFQKKAGGAVPSPDRITLLRDEDGDGVAETRSALLTGLRSPFGMALVGEALYVANTDALVRFPYTAGQLNIAAAPVFVTALPAGTINHSADGLRLFVGVGSNSNAAENGLAAEAGRACIWEIDPATGGHRVFASGLRNPVGMAWEPTSGALWVAVNERDELGDGLVPDYMTAARDGAFYGWPYSYYGDHIDARVKPARPDLVATAQVPDYALGAHTASLGLASARGTSLPGRFSSGMFIGQHGSWNRVPIAGYKVIFVPFVGGVPSGMPLDVLTGFVNTKGEAMGRPVGVALDRTGALLVADDVGDVIWRVSSTVAP